MASVHKRIRNGKVSYRVQFRDPAGHMRGKVGVHPQARRRPLRAVGGERQAHRRLRGPGRRQGDLRGARGALVHQHRPPGGTTVRCWTPTSCQPSATGRWP
jgi:hypothetical protein